MKENLLFRLIISLVVIIVSGIFVLFIILFFQSRTEISPKILFISFLVWLGFALIILSLIFGSNYLKFSRKKVLPFVILSIIYLTVIFFVGEGKYNYSIFDEQIKYFTDDGRIVGYFSFGEKFYNRYIKNYYEEKSPCQIQDVLNDESGCYSSFYPNLLSLSYSPFILGLIYLISCSFGPLLKKRK